MSSYSQFNTDAENFAAWLQATHPRVVENEKLRGIVEAMAAADGATKFANVPGDFTLDDVPLAKEMLDMAAAQVIELAPQPAKGKQ